MSDRRSVVKRTLKILETFVVGHDAMSLSELSRRSGIPLTTTFRIVTELAEGGVLERDGAGNYRIGLRLWEVASLAPRSVGLQRIALPYMQDLYETTHLGVHLAVREKSEVVFVERLVSPDNLSGSPRVGGRYAMHATAVGMVLLAYAPKEILDDLLSGPLPSFTRRTCTDPHELRRVLADARRKGYAYSDRQISNEFVSVASPIYGAEGGVVAALSLIVPFAEAKGPAHGHLVQSSARAISRALGANLSTPRSSRALRESG